MANIVNVQYLNGRIVGIHTRKDGSGSLTLNCPIFRVRRTKQGWETIAMNLYPSIIFGKKEGERVKTFSRGDNVCIASHAMSHFRQNQNGEAADVLTLFLDDIQPDPSGMESIFGIRGRMHPAPRNECYVSGKLVSMIKMRNGTRVRVDASDGNRHNFVSGVCYSPADRAFMGMGLGEEVCLAGYIQTPDLTKTEKIMSYDNFVIQDAASLEAGRKPQPEMQAPQVALQQPQAQALQEAAPQDTMPEEMPEPQEEPEVMLEETPEPEENPQEPQEEPQEEAQALQEDPQEVLQMPQEVPTVQPEETEGDTAEDNAEV